jgi:hypothetical protein
MLRALLAAGLAALLAASAAQVHVHDAEAGAEQHHAPCPVCQLRGAEPVGGDAPHVAPRVVSAADVVLPPGPSPVTGAPLGAIPGQSPPAAA